MSIFITDFVPVNYAIKKYGKRNFKRYVLLHCDKTLGNYYEVLWIKKFKCKFPNGYNLTDGGEGTVGYIFTEKDIKSISDSHKGKPKSKEHNKLNSDSHKGKTLSELTKKKIGLSISGNKNGNFGKGYLHSGEKNGNSKLNVIQVREIRNSNLKLKELAKIYNVGYDTIWEIKTFRRWKTVEAK